MLIIPCFYKDCKELCPYNHNKDSCKNSIHHLFWPKRLYQTKLVKHWRDKSEHKVVMCRGLHDLFHLINYVPKMPDLEQIKDEEVIQMKLLEAWADVPDEEVEEVTKKLGEIVPPETIFRARGGVYWHGELEEPKIEAIIKLLCPYNLDFRISGR